MDKPRNRRFPWPLIAAVLILALLALFPKTGWLFRQEIQMQFGLNAAMVSLLRDLGVRSELAEKKVWEPRVDVKSVSDKHPNDFQMQLAYVLYSCQGDQQTLNNLKALKARFPSLPSLQAQILRILAQKVHVSRNEWETLSRPARSPSSFNVPPHKNDPEQVAEFDRVAAEGERLDPGNAFFPAMRAMSLFAMQRDEEALDAVRRAGRASRWDEYLYDETEGRLRLLEEARGRTPVLSDAAVSASILFPHYAQLRAVARMAAYSAAQAEKSGDMRGGIAIRHGMLRIGGLMRAKSTTLIGSLVGMAIDAIAISHPAGKTKQNEDEKLSADARAAKRLQEYCDFAARSGHKADADLAAEELRLAKIARDSSKGLIDASPIGGKPMFGLMLRWFCDSLLLSNVLWFLAVGAGSLLLSRLRKASGVLAIQFLVTMLVVLGIMVWSSRWSEAFFTYYQVVQNLTESGESAGMPLWLVRVGSIVAALAAPLMFSVICLIYCAVTKSSIASALGRAASGVALFFTVIYCLGMLSTLRQEDSIRATLRSTLRGEAQYLAAVEHKQWPGLPTQPN